jgi:Flp pilus assembly pilin Flp
MDRLRCAAMRAAVAAAHLRASPLTNDAGDASAKPRESERGQGLAEYALILALIAIIAIAALALLGQDIADLVLNTIAGAIQTVVDNLP